MHYAEGSFAPRVIGDYRVELIRPTTTPSPLVDAEDTVRFAEDYLSRHPYFGGAEFSAADIMMLFPVNFATSTKVIDISKFPRLAAWRKKMERTPSDGSMPASAKRSVYLIEPPPRSFELVRNYENALFQHPVIPVIEAACDLEKTKVIPSRYILAATEQIGQEQANDVSDIFLFEEGLDKEPRVTELVRNARIFTFMRTLGAAYTVKHGVSSLRWKKDLTYSWS